MADCFWPVILLIPGASYGLVEILTDDGGVPSIILCNCCGEESPLPKFIAGKEIEVSMLHGSGCPLTEMQDALDKDNRKSVLRLLKRAKRVMKSRANAVMN